MFKKIEIWILYLFILLSIPVTVGFSFLVRYELHGGKKLGQLSKAALFISEMPFNLKKLFSSSIQVEDRFPLLDGFYGAPNSNQSYLLLSRYDGDLNEGIVELVDLNNFKTLHTWNPDINELNKSVKKVDQFKYLDRDSNNLRYLLKHPLLTSDGGLVFKHNSPLRKIDACSNLVFQNKNTNFHHSLEKDIEENIWVPSYLYPQSLPVEKVGRKIRMQKGFIDDAIVKLSAEGEILFEKSVSQIFIDNGLEYLLFSVGDKTFTRDPIHINDIQPVDFDGKFWKKGDVFLSLRAQSMVLLYRPSSNKIIWRKTGPFFHQHDIDILNDHTISVFNNNSKTFVDGEVVDGNNQVITYDFKLDEYSYYLNESLINNDVRTITEGRSQILQNGDLFVEETNFGRILYFNSDGSLRWTYVNRADNNKNYVTSWSRVLYKKKDIQNVINFLQSKRKCYV